MEAKDRAEAEPHKRDAYHPELKLAGVDLNLLVALEALLTRRNVTHAARRVGQTQPAMSRSLARLRSLLGDDLLVRGSHGLQLTARGEYLAQRLPVAMGHIREVIFSRQPEMEVRLTVTEHLSPVLLPGLVRHMPGGKVPLRVGTHKTYRAAIDQLGSRAADFMLGAMANLDSELHTRTIFSEELVTLLAPEHYLRIGARPASEAFLGMTHAFLVDDGEEAFPQVCEALIRAGVPRSRLFELADLTGAALMTSGSDLALTVPQSVARWLQKTMNLKAIRPAIPFARHSIVIGWLSPELDPAQEIVVGKIVSSMRTALDDLLGGVDSNITLAPTAGIYSAN